MRLLPAASAVELSIGGAGILLAGATLSRPAVAGWGAALLVGLTFARVMALVRVAQVRAAGLEMTWKCPGTLLQLACGTKLKLEAELCNRSSHLVRVSRLRVLASPLLETRVAPSACEIPPGGSCLVSVSGTPERIGQFGVTGLALELSGEAGGFEVPLTFASPMGISVVPGSRSKYRPRRTGRGAFAGAKGGLRTVELGDFAELRDHQSGDAFHRIAWKASARRGRLMTRTFEQTRAQDVWFLLDASVELWSGRPGAAPLDVALRGVSRRMAQQLLADHRVGLVVVHGHLQHRVQLAGGKRHLSRLERALAQVPAAVLSERGVLEPESLALTALEHMRLLVPRKTARLRVSDVKKVARMATEMLPTAPFDRGEDSAPTDNETALLAYLRGFGLLSRPVDKPQATRTQRTLASVVTELTKPRLGVGALYVVAPLPDETSASELGQALCLPRRQAGLVHWIYCRERVELSGEGAGARSAETAAELATVVRSELGERRLRKWGIRAVECLDPKET